MTTDPLAWARRYQRANRKNVRPRQCVPGPGSGGQYLPSRSAASYSHARTTWHAFTIFYIFFLSVPTGSIEG